MSDDLNIWDSFGRSRIVSWLRDRIIRPQHIENAESSGYLLTTDTGPDGSLTSQWQSVSDLELVSDGDLDAELAEKADRIHRHQGVEIDNVPSGTISATNVQDAINELEAEAAADATALANHLADTSDAHDASAISILDTAGDFTATDVEGALAELQADAEADATALADHLADTSDAHDASAISNVPAGNIAATTVQAAIDELDSEKLSTTTAASTYVELAGDTMTGALTLNYASPVLTLQGTSGQSEIRIDGASGQYGAINFKVNSVSQWLLSGSATNLRLYDSVNSAYMLTVTPGSTFDILPADPAYTDDAKVAGQSVWHDGNAFSRVKVITEPDILMAQSMALEAQKEAVDLDALMDRKIDFELDQKADIYHHHNNQYTNSARFAAGMYVANSGTPAHTAVSNYQKIATGATYTSEFDIRPDGYSAQVDASTNKRIDIRYPGLYLVKAQVAFSGIADAKIVGACVYKNGTRVAEETNSLGVANAFISGVSQIVACNVGDYLELYAYQSDSASEAYLISSSYYNYIHAIYLCPTAPY